MGFDEWWQLNARFGDDKVRFRQLWSAAIECAQRETVRYAEVQVAAERERWLIAVRTNQPEFERFDDQRAAGNTCRAILQAVGIEA